MLFKAAFFSNVLYDKWKFTQEFMPNQVLYWKNLTAGLIVILIQNYNNVTFAFFQSSTRLV